VLIKSRKDFYSGLMFVCAGLAFAIGARSYSVGEGARMGPGYFPMMLGIVLTILGCFITLNALRGAATDGDPVGRFAWKPIVYVLGANLAFGVLLGGLPSIHLPAMGMIAAIYALTLIASLAGDQFRLRDVLILATILAVGSYLAFIMLLKLQIQVWPTFITG
jgi:Tripartite tricarboxylate transporter TctB family